MDDCARKEHCLPDLLMDSMQICQKTGQPAEKGRKPLATIKDVAERAGLSVGTVSRILNNRGYISEKSREKVEQAMKELNYQPNEVARALYRQTTNLIGLIVPHIRHPYFASMISEIEMEAGRLGYRILLFNTKDRESKLNEYIEQSRRHRVTGIILCSPDLSESGKDPFTDLHIPIVTIERHFESATASVECDNFMGGKLQAQHLIEIGKKNLVILSGGNNEEMPADDRTRGALLVAEKNQVACREERTTKEEYNDGNYYERISRLLRNSVTGVCPIDGILASSDVIASQVIQVAAEYDLRIPEDLAVVGFDDTMVARTTMPNLTTIHQPIQEMAQSAVHLLMDASEGKVVPMRTVLPVSLVVRGSTVKEMHIQKDEVVS